MELLKIAIPVLIAVLAWLFNEYSKRKWERWQMNRDACLGALNIANAVLSNYQYTNVGKDEIMPQHESIEAIRACFNELACTCETPTVINALKRIMFEQVSPDEIQVLRAAVRKELGMGADPIDTDKDRAFVGRVNCNKPN